MANIGNRGFTFSSLSTPQARNAAEMGLTETIILKGAATTNNVCRFRSGLILNGETVPIKSDTAKGFRYDSSGDTLYVYIGLDTSVKAKNSTGELLTIDGNTFLFGTVVRINESPWPEYNGEYRLSAMTISSNQIEMGLKRAEWNGEADITANQPSSRYDADFDGDGDGGYLTVVPFSNAYCVEILGVDGLGDTVTAVGDSATIGFDTFHANNLAGAFRVVSNMEFAVGTRLLGDITDVRPGTDVIVALYCQHKADMRFSPERVLSGSGGKGDRSGESGRYS